MQRRHPRSLFLFTLFVFSILFLEKNLLAVTVTGVFEDHSPSKLYADISLNLTTESIVTLTYRNSCADPADAKIELYNAWNVRMMTAKPQYGQPLGSFPLTAGHWTVRVHCEHENYNPNNPVAYTLEETIETGSSLYDKDSEPDATPVLVLKNGKFKVENE